jgi:hypothetical protein
MPINPSELAFRYAFAKHADMYPALGFPGGPCQVMERIKDEVGNPRLQEALVDQVESGRDLSNQQAHKIYDLEAENGPSGTRFKKLYLTAHVQYRMDLRGVNVSDLKLFFKRFQKAWNDSRSRKEQLATRWESDMAWGKKISWVDSAGLLVAFTVKDRSATVITTYWDGLSDPRPVDEDTCVMPARQAAAKFPEYRGKSEAWLRKEWQLLEDERAGNGYGPKPVGWVPRSVSNPEVIERQRAIRIERGVMVWQRPWADVKALIPERQHRKQVERALRQGEDVPQAVLDTYPDLAAGRSRRALKMPAEFGIKTLVRDDSAKGLPTDLDRTKEQALPLPGSATPGGAGRDIPKFESNTPDSDSNIQPRTLGVPGEEYGHPSNDTYNTVTRRTMTSSWMLFKGDFPGVKSPLFHATTGPRAANIALRGQGLKSDSGFSNFGGQDGISLSRDLGFLLRGDFGKVIFVFDRDELSRRFSVEPSQHPSAPDEYEERVFTDAIPASLIRGVILNFDPLPFEVAEWHAAVGYTVVYQERRTRKWVTGSDEGFDKEGFRKSWKPGQRQRRTRGPARQKGRAYRRKNKNKLRLKAKKWRKKNKNKGAFKASEKRRRTTNRRRRASAELVAHQFLLAETMPPKVRGGPSGGRQNKQPTEDRLQDRDYYRDNKSRRKRESELWYKQECRKDRRCKDRRQNRQEDPSFVKRGPARRRREASLLTVPEIAFGIGPEMELGYIRSISSMTGMVNFEIDGDDVFRLGSLPVEVFLRVAAFMSDEDMDAFFELVDSEIGLEAYEDLDEDGLRECAAMYGKDPDSEEFRNQCTELTGEADLNNLSAEQLDVVNDSLVLGVLEGGGDPRDSESGSEGDETIGDEYDPHLYYGEVEREKALKESALRVARAWQS